MKSGNILICPVCQGTLSNDDKRFYCSNNHSFDISRSGYVNLLRADERHSREPGDSPEMIRARNRFLGQGHYAALAQYLAKVTGDIQASTEAPFTLLDAGCGEGYFLSMIYKALGMGRIRCFGIDISRDAISIASKRHRHATYAVAGIFNMPVASSSVDCLLNIFAPSPATEFHRVLADNGTLVHVYPGDRHLLGLREKLFSTVTPLRKDDRLSESFDLQSTGELEYSITVPGNENIADLVNMTPYAWKTGREKIASFIAGTGTLETTVHFIISIYKNRT